MRTEADLFKPKRHDLRELIRKAFKHPYNGKSVVPNRHFLVVQSLTEVERYTGIVITFDTGTHTSGWWRNSQYDRCLHLSLSHIDEATTFRERHIETPSRKEAEAWAKAVFGQHYSKLWIEPAASALDPYRLTNVMHIRLFLDQQNKPIQPSGEVYTLKPFTDGSSPAKVFR